MHAPVIAALLMLAVQTEAVCRIGSWTGTPAELAAIEAVYQREAAERAGQAFPSGAPQPSPWSQLAHCR